MHFSRSGFWDFCFTAAGRSAHSVRVGNPCPAWRWPVCFPARLKIGRHHRNSLRWCCNSTAVNWCFKSAKPPAQSNLKRRFTARPDFVVVCDKNAMKVSTCFCAPTGKASNLATNMSLLIVKNKITVTSKSCNPTFGPLPNPRVRIIFDANGGLGTARPPGKIRGRARCPDRAVWGDLAHPGVIDTL